MLRPSGSSPAQYRHDPVATIDRLTLIYIVIYLTLGCLAALAFSRFPFGRAEHEARLARMAAAAEDEGAPHAP